MRECEAESDCLRLFSLHMITGKIKSRTELTLTNDLLQSGDEVGFEDVAVVMNLSYIAKHRNSNVQRHVLVARNTTPQNRETFNHLIQQRSIELWLIVIFLWQLWGEEDVVDEIRCHLWR